MKTVDEIERAIGELTRRELEELHRWLDKHDPEPIDARLQSEIASGQLDPAIRRALDDEAAGRTRAM